MEADHHLLIEAVSDYGRAMLEFGKKGGYKLVGEHPPMLVPVDEEARNTAGLAWGRVMDLLDQHFQKSVWRLMWERIWK